ncbi:hypothetical protein [Phocaeicola massiliensis]|uniref:hypothetical protein n=1 Tax=Phocaeicola massiliensis TaxID=204516 RepID=UPI001B62F936|nr:hypothetical protein [Phocaeicola massiliensis]MBP9481723.1 hypothetical protein [Parabacteroides sp.]MCM1616262.1 hypothetical protein [Phocaeicola massiliensis]MCM1707923.1 hypothetical protein [Phocaeicola massiliensis]
MFGRTDFDLKNNALDYFPLKKIIGEVKEVKITMQINNEETEAMFQYQESFGNLFPNNS